MIKVNIHSVVDLITNSSTTVFIYRDSVTEVKELVQEMLNIAGITDKTPDDIFYYGVFPNFESYLERLDDGYGNGEYPKEMPKITTRYDTNKYKKQKKARDKWMEDLQLAIMKGEKEEPDWFEEAYVDYNDFPRSTYLFMIARDEKYSEFAAKIQKLLNSIGGDGYRDG